MTTGLILAGLGLTAVGFAGRYALRYGKLAQNTIRQQLDSIPSGPTFSKFYKGGFEPKMSKREAGLILGVSPSASKAKIKEAHKRVMLLNHPDKGSSLDETEVARTTNVDNFPSSQPPKRLKEDGGFTN